MNNRHAKLHEYKPKGGHAKQLAHGLIWAAFLSMVGFLVLAWHFNTERTGRQVYKTTELCEISRPCNLTLEATYDTEPMDLILCSPTGGRYPAIDIPDVQYLDDEKKIRMTVMVTDPGTWTADYNMMRNKNINLSVRLDPIDKLFLSNLQCYQDEQGGLFLEFETQFGDLSDTETMLQATVRMRADQKYPTVYDSEIPLNTPVRLQLDDTNLITGTWTMELVVCKSVMDGNDPYRANATIARVEFTKPDATSPLPVENTDRPTDTDTDSNRDNT